MHDTVCSVASTATCSVAPAIAGSMLGLCSVAPAIHCKAQVCCHDPWRSRIIAPSNTALLAAGLPVKKAMTAEPETFASSSCDASTAVSMTISSLSWRSLTLTNAAVAAFAAAAAAVLAAVAAALAAAAAVADSAAASAASAAAAAVSAAAAAAHAASWASFTADSTAQ